MSCIASYVILSNAQYNSGSNNNNISALVFSLYVHHHHNSPIYFSSCCQSILGWRWTAMILNKLIHFPSGNMVRSKSFVLLRSLRF
ncbi:hypothetical protein Leryth_016919 [Lithospermum erythrorhizon]|nr:hypothetical protein Leryth_016919 [Lithospermum erythrorhizon]